MASQITGPAPGATFLSSERSEQAWIRRLAGRVTEWIDTACRYYAAEAMHEELRRLSHAELSRRGLSRATLGHAVRDGL